MPHHEVEGTLSYLPSLKHHHRLFKHQVPVNEEKRHGKPVTYKSAVKTPGGLQAWDACNKRCEECDELPSDLISRAGPT